LRTTLTLLVTFIRTPLVTGSALLPFLLYGTPLDSFCRFAGLPWVSTVDTVVRSRCVCLVLPLVRYARGCHAGFTRTVGLFCLFRLRYAHCRYLPTCFAHAPLWPSRHAVVPGLPLPFYTRCSTFTPLPALRLRCCSYYLLTTAPRLYLPYWFAGYTRVFRLYLRGCCRLVAFRPDSYCCVAPPTTFIASLPALVTALPRLQHAFAFPSAAFSSAVYITPPTQLLPFGPSIPYWLRALRFTGCRVHGCAAMPVVAAPTIRFASTSVYRATTTVIYCLHTVLPVLRGFTFCRVATTRAVPHIHTRPVRFYPACSAVYPAVRLFFPSCLSHYRLLRGCFYALVTWFTAVTRTRYFRCGSAFTLDCYPTLRRYTACAFARSRRLYCRFRTALPFPRTCGYCAQFFLRLRPFYFLRLIGFCDLIRRIHPVATTAFTAVGRIYRIFTTR